MGLALIPEPRHFVKLECELVHGLVPVGVPPELLLRPEGVSMILGNNLAGSRVWATVPPPLVVSKPVLSEESALSLSGVFPACAVTWAQNSKGSTLELLQSWCRQSGVSEYVVPLPELPSSVSRQDWVKKADSSLSGLWDRVLPANEIRDVAQGYFALNELLLHKWMPSNGDFLREAVFQMVVPSDFREVVLKTVHDDCGHLGIKQMYDRVLCYFFWP